jgi:hypothetical protein
MTIEDSTPEDKLGEEELDNVSGAGAGMTPSTRTNANYCQ